MRVKHPQHYIKTEDGKGGALTWCNKFLLLKVGFGHWTRTMCQADCYPCIAAKHADMRRQGKVPMRDPM